MPSLKNQETVKQLKEKIAKSKSIVLADYKGLNVAQSRELREKVKAAGGELKIAKNTLMKISLKELQYKAPEAELTGSTATLFSYDDEVGPIKALYEFADKNELPKIKAGFLGKDSLTVDQVINLARLPSKLILQGKLVNVLNSPIAGFVYALKGNINKLVYVLEAISKKKD